MIFNPLQPSGHYMYHQFNIHQFYVLHTHTEFLCLVCIWEQTAIIPTYSMVQIGLYNRDLTL
jgi:hypothetical protein